MPTYVDPNACNACAGVQQGPLCVYICPNDLMILHPALNKGVNREPEMCSECYACVKLCPQDAIGPTRVEQGLRWTVRFRDGRELQFTYPSRSTPVGSSTPYTDFTEDLVQDLRTQALAGDSLWRGVDRLPTLNPR